MTTRKQAYAATEKALHIYGPAACRLVGHEDHALKLEAVVLIEGEPADNREGAAHLAWRALGEAEYRCGGPEAWPAVVGTATGPTGRTGAETEAERWALWVARTETWKARAGQ